MARHRFPPIRGEPRFASRQSKLDAPRVARRQNVIPARIEVRSVCESIGSRVRGKNRHSVNPRTGKGVMALDARAAGYV